jgi:hypothetical protein
MTTKKESTKPEYPMSIETFRKVSGYELSNLNQSETSVLNGWVRVEKYRVTVERIEEPVEVYAERLQKLWDESNNPHDYSPLQNKAKQLVVTLTGERGNKINQYY